MNQLRAVSIALLVTGCLLTSTQRCLGDNTLWTEPVSVPGSSAVNIRDTKKFLNDLKLSPYWKMELNAGTYRAIARSMRPKDWWGEDSGQLLFEFFASGSSGLPQGYVISNDGLSRSGVWTTLSAEIVFGRVTEKSATIAGFGQIASLSVVEPYDATLGGNSWSKLVIKISDGSDVNLVVREQGPDRHRVGTKATVQSALNEIRRLMNLGSNYRVRDEYSRVFSVLFGNNLGDHGLRRFPGLQDRDTFCGYLTWKEGVNVEGVNLRVSHDQYCGGEGTRPSDRLRKAEYLGNPYQDEDRLFFAIEDNAVYLAGDFNKDFGTFSGNRPFDGTLEVLGGDGKPLYSSVEKFRGWER